MQWTKSCSIQTKQWFSVDVLYLQLHLYRN